LKCRRLSSLRQQTCQRAEKSGFRADALGGAFDNRCWNGWNPKRT
jgi:hypothetical protein